MSVIPLTIFFSLLLAGTFVVLFAREQRRRHLTSPERDSLLPLADETPVPVRISAIAQSRHGRPRGLSTREPAAAACGCRRDVRPPCARCLRSRDEQDPAHF